MTGYLLVLLLVFSDGMHMASSKRAETFAECQELQAEIAAKALAGRSDLQRVTSRCVALEGRNETVVGLEVVDELAAEGQ